MEPLNDEQLKEILREWRVPAAPAHLEAKVFARPTPLWRWLLTGSIPIPVPVVVLALIALAAIFYSTRKAVIPVGLANFQPVKQLNIRVIRSNYEPH
ncbi:MAG: hypothetical protein ABJB49_10485 [Nitrospirota bacterium]